MNPLIAASFNRLGIVLQVFSFFFSTSRGGRFLHRFELHLRYFIRGLKIILRITGILVGGAILLALDVAFISGLNISSSILRTFLPPYLSALLSLCLLIILFALTLLLIVPRKLVTRMARIHRLKSGFDQGLEAFMNLVLKIVIGLFFQPILTVLDQMAKVLADDTKRQRRYTIYTAVTFLVGTLMQFAATF